MSELLNLPGLKTKLLSFVMLMTLMISLFASSPVSRVAAQRGAFQQGMSFAAWWSGQYIDPGADLSLEALADTGTTWISLIVTAYQDTPTSTTIDRTSASTPTDAELIHVITLAHSLGLKVMLKPHLDLRNEQENDWWRGDIGPTFTSEPQWAAWFTAYRGFIEHYARLAETYGADQFCVGTELLGTTHRAADWRAVVAGVRAVYGGPLTYAALHSGEETSITWWDAVDYIGVDAYYPLTQNRPPDYHPTTEELEAAWVGPKATLAALSAAYGRPIIFTEIGYRSHHGCGCHPWDSWAVSPVDLEEQAFAYEAAFRQLYNEPWLMGIFWWTWYADRFKSGPYDASFSPYAKPAEDVLRAWYGGAPRAPEPSLLADEAQTLTVYCDGLASGWQDWSWGATISSAVPGAEGAAEVALEPWGTLSLWHSAFSSDAYYWLEFSIRSSTAEEPRLVVFFDAVEGVRLASAPVNDPRHIEDGTITATGWKRVRIPIAVLNAHGDALERLSIQNVSGDTSAAFWIDDLRLIGAKAPTDWAFLPLVVRSGS